MKFPVQFEERMIEALGELEFEQFMTAYHQKPFTGLRVNTLKVSVKTFLAIFPYTLKPIPWTEDGFYYDSEDPVTKHPFFYAGLYYIQEPSAMAPVTILNPKPNAFSLDLCAAPGGKTLQIANKTGDTGMLVTNDINDTRVKAILRNIEKFGLRNVIVLNETPEKIASKLKGLFDSVLIDAPCSGEGMFKKDSKAIQSYEKFGPLQCSAMQLEILSHLPKFIGKASKVVYSTCTFAPVENEEQIERLIQKDEFEPSTIDVTSIEVKGHLAHIWPHKHPGEGHFIAKLNAKGQETAYPVQKYEANQPPVELSQFLEMHIKTDVMQGCYAVINEKVYLKPDYKLPIDGLRIVREGLFVGELKNKRFTPSQPLAMFLKSVDFEPILDFKSDSIEVVKYLKGETLHVDMASEGYHLVCTEGYPLGFAKVSSGVLKNLYPPSWRRL